LSSKVRPNLAQVAGGVPEVPLAGFPEINAEPRPEEDALAARIRARPDPGIA
jgi:hypothetical protein